MMRGQSRLTDIQAQQVEVGRIRMGKTEMKRAKSGNMYPDAIKLDRFRLTSRSQQLIVRAAELYGGQVEPWTPNSGGTPQWEVIIEAESLPVIVPPDSCSQYYESWAGGRCQLRCTGQRELLEDQPCVCGPDPVARRCKPTTRLSLMLAEMPGIGVWRLETHGYYAATELPAIADLLSAAGGNVPARLEMEERSAQIEDKNGKSTTARFKVPVLHVEATPAQIMSTFGSRVAIGSDDGSPQVTIGGSQTLSLPAGGGTPDPPPAQAPASAPPDPTLRKLYMDLMTEIVNATTPEQMQDIKRRTIESDLPELAKDKIGGAWNGKALILKEKKPVAMPSQSQVSPAPPTQEEAGDPMQVWSQIQMWAGQRTPPLKLSALREMFQQFAGKGVHEATVGDLRRFFEQAKQRGMGA